MRRTLIFVSLWVVIISLFSWIVFNRLYITEPDKAQFFLDGQYPLPHKLDFVEMHERGDSAWYISIANKGYSFSKDSQSNINFFPLYPLTMKLLKPTIALILPAMSVYKQFIISGVLISLFSFFIGIIILHKLLNLDFKKSVVEQIIFYLLIFPTSFFFLQVYSESLYLMLSVAAFYFARKNKWFLSGLFGLLSTLTRSTGILLMIPLVTEWWSVYTRKRSIPIKSFFNLLLLPCGLLFFMIFYNLKFNEPLAFIKAAEFWGRQINLSLVTSLLSQFKWLLNYSSASQSVFLFEIIYLSFGLITSIIVLKRIRLSYGVYCLLGTLLPPFTGILVGEGRYLLPLFPLFIPPAYASEKNWLFYNLYSLISILLLSLHIILFVNSYLGY